MSVDATPLPSRIARPRLAIRLVELPDRALLGGLVILTAAVRFAVALLHTTPRFFPDEYIYPALAQSLLHGRLEIRGEPAHFPALLESIVTAPLWLAGGVELPFRLTQLLHAVLAAAAIIPIYAICRRLDLPRWQRFACAAITAVLPVFIYATYVSADALGTLVALAAIATGTALIAAPARRREVLFLALAGLATFARVQYVVLLPAFALAALVICHWRPWRTVRCFPVVAASFAAAAACALALGPSRLLGYYDGLLDTGIAPLAMARWAGTDLVLLACAGGLVLAPAAAVGLAWGIARPRSRVEHAFAALSGSFLLLTLLAAVIYNTNGSPRFQERYFMAVLPLLAPLACLGTQRLSARGPRLVLAGATLGLLAFIAGKPLPDYVQDNGDQDSPLLQGVVWLTWRLGTTPAGLGLAVLAAAVLLATAVGLVFSLTHRSSAFMLAAAALLLTLASLAAVGTDLTYANGAWKSALGRDARWIDNAKQGQVSVVLPRITLRWIVSEQLFWNRSLDRVLSLSDAVPPDAFQSMPVRIDQTGVLLELGQPVRRPILFEEYGASAQLDDAKLISREGNASLWRPRDTVRFAMLTDGLYLGDELGYRGAEINLWPRATGPRTGVLCLRLGVAKNAAPVTIAVGSGTWRRRFVLDPGRTRHVSLPLTIDRPTRVNVRRPKVSKDESAQVITMAAPRFVDRASAQTPAAACR